MTLPWSPLELSLDAPTTRFTDVTLKEKVTNKDYDDNNNGASVSEPHTSESNWNFSYIIIVIISGVRRSVYSQRCNLTQ